MTDSNIDYANGLPEIRRRFVQVFAIVVVYLPILRIFSFVAEKMGGLGPISFPISVLALVIFLILWIRFLYFVYKFAKALELGSWSIPLAVLSVVPLFGFIIGIWLIRSHPETIGSEA